MGSHPRPHWFLIRPDNTITPLIAVDELPPSIYIAGVPAAMSLVDTKSMESVGVRERSCGTYDVRGRPAAIPSIKCSDSEPHARTSSECGTDLPPQNSVSASESRAGEGSEAEAKEILSEPLSSTLVQPPVDKTNYEEASKPTEMKPCRVQDEEASNVEKWRQDVENADETQVILAQEVQAGIIGANRNRPGLMPWLLLMVWFQKRTDPLQKTKILAMTVRKLDLFQARKSTAAIGLGRVIATLYSKVASTNTKCQMTIH